MSNTKSERPDTGQTVIVREWDGKVLTSEVSGMVVDALSSQFTFIPFGERDIRRVRFCFYNGDWE